MTRTKLVKIALVSAIILGGWALNEYATTFMRYKITVFVNDVENVEDAECHWAGGHYFDVITRGVRARCNVLVHKRVQLMSASITGGEDVRIQVASIKLSLIHTDASGKSRDIRMASESKNPPRIDALGKGRGWSWYQSYRIDEDLTEFSKGSLSLVWSMDKKAAEEEISSIVIIVPLRSEKIFIQNSIVGLDHIPREIS
ncbi:hypothetical protein [Schlesneria sp. DSM 10557]|uniref:hypothetical protein n=1 Tax=Schlesneria sp. DSM 10557 TaxID=3044399 RepID=UPI0035A09D39